MEDDYVTIAGELTAWPSKEQMAKILRHAGLKVTEGNYSIRVDDCSHFVFQEYGGDLGDPSIDADADTLAEMLSDGNLVSEALAKAGIRHRFEIYNVEGEMVGYLHFDWPLSNTH
jgi:hypothetical protein